MLLQKYSHTSIGRVHRRVDGSTVAKFPTKPLASQPQVTELASRKVRPIFTLLHSRSGAVVHLLRRSCSPPPMADPYRAYAPRSSYGRDPQGDFPGYLPPEGSYYASRIAALHGASDIIRADVPLQSRAYGLDVPVGVSHPDSAGLSALPAGARARGPTPLEDPALVRRSSSLGKSAGIPEVERPSPLLNVDGPLEDESNILFVDGLPTDCTRREVAHLFRPFVGFKDLRVVHKEPRHSGDKAYVLCFVEFSDAKCALTAMEALQEYRFDERKPDASVLKIQFARFPFRPPATHDDRRRLNLH